MVQCDNRAKPVNRGMSCLQMAGGWKNHARWCDSCLARYQYREVRRQAQNDRAAKTAQARAERLLASEMTAAKKPV